MVWYTSRMRHYVCMGECGGALEEPGVCESPDCSQNGVPREQCDCTDGYHGALFADTMSETDPDI